VAIYHPVGRELAMRKSSLLALAVIVLAGCGTGTSSGPKVQSNSEVPYRTLSINAGSGYFGGLAWPPGGWIFVAHSSGIPGALPEVGRFRPDGSAFAIVTLPLDPECTRTYYAGFGVLHDGHLAIGKVCQAPAGVSPSAGYAVIAYDPASSKTEQILPLQNKFAPGPVSFDRSGDRAVTAPGSSICVTIAYLTHRGVVPISAVIKDDNTQWRLDDYFRIQSGSDCRRTARADGPDWSPDGRQIAFFGFPKAIGVEGPARLDVPGNFYLLDPATLHVRELLHDVQYPSGARWSPNGRWLAFSARDVPDVGRGTWLLSVETGKLFRVSNRDLSDMAWAPDGTQLVGLWDNGKNLYPPDTELDLFDVRSITHT
jgi:hypothetical protein